MSAESSADRSGPAAEKVKEIFSDVAHGYDRANTWMTFGLVRGWRRELVRWSGAGGGEAVLDCATGTGDLAFAFKSVVGPEGRVVGTDFCEAMLEYAPKKGALRGLEVHFETADVLALPYAEESFDIVSIAYGIRNVEDPRRALSEMARVCKPGGRVMVLETGSNEKGWAGRLHWCFSEYGVPFLGSLMTGRRKPYEYLRDSSRAFPSREAFIALLEEAHPFRKVEYRSLCMGASFLYRAEI